MLRSLSSKCLVGASAIALLVHARDAAACGGGMFYSVSDQETVAVSGHAVVVSISKAQTVLWDRITYTGAPADFAWIMPVAPGATLELASAAWIEAILGATAPIVVSPFAECDGGGSSGSSSGGCCGSSDGAGLANDRGFGGGGSGELPTETVTVVHRAEIGPYTQETIKSDVPGAIGTWLTNNGYAIPASVSPILDDYAAQGMEFLALRLKPGSGVSDMKPVRVLMSGGLTTFPMRMLAAGAKTSVPITLAVIAEGRYEVKGFSNTIMNGAGVHWDFTAGKSDYPAVRAAALAGSGSATWLFAYAQKGSLLTPGLDGSATDEADPSVAELYAARGKDIGDAKGTCVTSGFEAIGQSGAEVVELCDDTTLPCSKLAPGQIDSATLACDGMDDLAKALVGLHPKDVWVTRLDADLPVAKLATDLTLVPAAKQVLVSRVVQAQEYTGDPCDGTATSALQKPSHHRRAAAPLGVLVFGIGLAFMRKASRKRR